MKVKYLIVVSLILTILTLSTVCASDYDNLTIGDEYDDVVSISNNSDDLTVDDDIVGASDDDVYFTNFDEGVVSEGNKQFNYYFYAPHEVVAHSKSNMQFGVYNGYSDVKGNVSLYIDDSNIPIYNQPAKYYKENANDIIIDGNFINFGDLDLSYGIHTAMLKFSGDDIYKSFNETWTFNYDYLFCSVNQEVSTTFHPEYMSIKIPYDMKGNFRMLLDDKEIISTALPSSNFNNYASGGTSLFSYLIPDLDFKQHNYTVIYSNGNYPNKQIVGKFNVTYNIIAKFNDGRSVSCGDVGELFLQRPSDGTGDFLVEFENRTYDVKVDAKTNNCVLTFDNFTKLGKQYISVKYQDSKYPLKEFLINFYVFEKFDIPTLIKYGDNENITLNLPYNATGDLLIYINNEFIQKIPLVNGRADYIIPQKVGHYEVKAVYNGTYTNLNDRFCNMNVIPNVISSKLVNINEDYNVNLTCNDEPNNSMIVKFKKYKTGETIVVYDGVQTSKLFTKEDLNLEAGYYSIYVNITVNNNVSHEFYCESLEIRSESRQFQISLQTYDEYLQFMTSKEFNNKMSYVKVLNIPSDGKGTVSLYINDKLISTNGYYAPYIYFSTNLLKKGNNKITVKYTGDRYYFDSSVSGIINVIGDFQDAKTGKIILTLIKVNVKKSAKKLVLTAILGIYGKSAKAKKLVFKFKGKKYTAKTNKYGIAKVTIKKSVLKKLKKGKKITYQVSYGNTVKKVTVKIKK